MDYRQYIDRLKENAAHCRRLAELATDPEARLALVEIATDIDAAIPIVEEDARRKGPGQRPS